MTNQQNVVAVVARVGVPHLFARVLIGAMFLVAYGALWVLHLVCLMILETSDRKGINRRKYDKDDVVRDTQMFDFPLPTGLDPRRDF